MVPSTKMGAVGPEPGSGAEDLRDFGIIADLKDMGFDRADRDAQFVRYLLVGLLRQEHRDDLELPLGEDLS